MIETDLDVPVAHFEKQEIWALKQAVEILGFDADALVRRMCESSCSYWPRLALGSTHVQFDPELARKIQPSATRGVLTEAEVWLDSIRLKPDSN